MMHRVRRTFLILLLMLVLAPGAALLARLLPEKAVSHLTNSYLSGVTKPVAPQWTLSSLLSGKLQNDLALWLGERMGRPRELMIRLNNGIGYGVGRSFSPYVVIGRERVLYPVVYVNDWCARSGRRNRVEGQAASIAKIRDLVEASGRQFILVISPGKPAVYPDYLRTACDGYSADRYVMQLKDMLPKHHVGFIDGTDTMLKAKMGQELPLFGRDGLHWNLFGASFAVDAIVDRLESQLQKPLRRLRVKDVAVDDRPHLVDEDLGDLLNLPFRLNPYPSVHPTFSVDMGGYAPRILMVGTSFSWQLLEILGRNRLSDDIKFYFYFSKIAQILSGEPQPEKESFAAEGDLSSGLAHAEVVILEVNEANIMSQHVKKFADALDKLEHR